MKHTIREEKDRGGALGVPRLTNELLKDNRHMSEKGNRRETEKERVRRMKSAVGVTIT